MRIRVRQGLMQVVNTILKAPIFGPTISLVSNKPRVEVLKVLKELPRVVLVRHIESFVTL